MESLTRAAKQLDWTKAGPLADFPRAELLTLLDAMTTHLRFDGVHRVSSLETNKNTLLREGTPLRFQFKR